MIVLKNMSLLILVILLMNNLFSHPLLHSKLDVLLLKALYFMKSLRFHLICMFFQLKLRLKDLVLRIRTYLLTHLQPQHPSPKPLFESKFIHVKNSIFDSESMILRERTLKSIMRPQYEIQEKNLTPHTRMFTHLIRILLQLQRIRFKLISIL